MALLLDVDPGLAEAVAPEQRDAARAGALAPLHTVQPGPWDITPLLRAVVYGLLIVSGLAASDVALGHLEALELLGPGDLLHPPDGVPVEAVPMRRHWSVVTPLTYALLDREFALRVRAWPQIPAALLARAGERCDVLTYHLAARHAVRVEDRLLLIFWQLAERWGRVGVDGTTVRIPGLNHTGLARLVGARRSPVTKALGELRRGGVIEQTGSGEWMLRGEPADVLARVGVTRGPAE